MANKSAGVSRTKGVLVHDRGPGVQYAVQFSHPSGGHLRGTWHLSCDPPNLATIEAYRQYP